MSTGDSHNLTQAAWLRTSQKTIYCLTKKTHNIEARPLLCCVLVCEFSGTDPEQNFRFNSGLFSETLRPSAASHQNNTQQNISFIC